MIREVRFGSSASPCWTPGLGRSRGRVEGTASMLIPDHFPAGASGQQLAPSTIMAAPYFLRALSCVPRMPTVAAGKQREPRRDDP